VAAGEVLEEEIAVLIQYLAGVRCVSPWVNERARAVLVWRRVGKVSWNLDLWEAEVTRLSIFLFFALCQTLGSWGAFEWRVWERVDAIR